MEFQYVKPGKGAVSVKTKLKNIISGGGKNIQTDRRILPGRERQWKELC